MDFETWLDERIISLVEAREFLWNSEDERHKLRNVVANGWQDITNHLNEEIGTKDPGYLI